MCSNECTRNATTWKTTHLLLGNHIYMFLQALQILLQAARMIEIDADLFEQLVDLQCVTVELETIK